MIPEPLAQPIFVVAFEEDPLRFGGSVFPFVLSGFPGVDVFLKGGEPFGVFAELRESIKVHSVTTANQDIGLKSRTISRASERALSS